MARNSLKAMYASIAGQATLAEAGGLSKPRAVLLLWFLRNVVGVGELDAYDYVCDGDNDKGIDGLFLERGIGRDSPDTLVILQSKYTEAETSRVGATEIDRLAGAANHFVSASTVKALRESGPERSLLHLLDRLSIESAIEQAGGSLPTRLIMVTTGQIHPDAQRKVRALRELHDDGHIELWDVNKLGPLAVAVESPKRIQKSVAVRYAGEELSITGSEPNRVAVLPIRASELAGWPDIDNRKLFALNVRHELKSNSVSRGLDGAIVRTQEHKDFLAYHNGITLVCDKFKAAKGRLIIDNPSVVNGAQSVLAFQRAFELHHLTDDLRVFVKIVEVAGRPLLEKEVGRRSNTQTGVNPRNLMANHGTQLRLEREFKDLHQEFIYETRPDTIKIPAGKTLVKNDDAAQLLCAVVNRWPWLAVKKNTLFLNEHHPQIFSERVHAHHIIFLLAIRGSVERVKEEMPDAYRSSWLLTRLASCYLLGELLRESGTVSDPLAESGRALCDKKLLACLDELAAIVAVTLTEHHEKEGPGDNFKVDFKNEEKLIGLAAEARRTYKLAMKLKARPNV